METTLSTTREGKKEEERGGKRVTKHVEVESDFEERPPSNQTGRGDEATRRRAMRRTTIQATIVNWLDGGPEDREA